MQKDALEFLSKQAVTANGTFAAVSAEPKDVYFVRQPDGTVARMLAEPAPRNYVAASIEDFVELVKELPKGTSKALVLVGQRDVTSLLDEDSRRERVHFPLKPTTGFITLQECFRARRPLDQKAFVSMLRVELNGCVDPTLVVAFRQIRFEKTTEGETVVTNSNKAISSKIQMKLAAGGTDIPDEITASIAVYEEFPTTKQPVRCAVDTCIEDGTFTLIPLAGELQTAQVETQGAIQRGLQKGFDGDGSQVKIYCGEVNC